jgi:anti-sigma-K factor RskA
MAAEDDLDVLAGEYVLGTLAPDERAAVERRLLDNQDLARRVSAWEQRLAPLCEDLSPITPRPAVWQQVRRAIGASRREAPPPWWRRLGLWQGWAGAATAVAIGLLGFVLATPAPPPQLVAVLNDADGRPLWLIRASAEAPGLSARQLGAGAPPGRVPELWLLPVGAERPVSLGVLDPAGINRRTLGSLPSAALRAGGLLEVSLEPPGGSPTGLPTGPVVSKGFLVTDPT